MGNAAHLSKQAVFIWGIHERIGLPRYRHCDVTMMCDMHGLNTRKSKGFECCNLIVCESLKF